MSASADIFFAESFRIRLRCASVSDNMRSPTPETDMQTTPKPAAKITAKHIRDHITRSGSNCIGDYERLADINTESRSERQALWDQFRNLYSEPSPAAITALKHRAQLLILTGAWLGKERNMAYGQGALNHLCSLANGIGQKAADKDALQGGYQPPALFQRAWPRLPVNIERFTMAEVQEFLRAQGIQLATDTVAHSQLDGVEQLEDGKLPGVVANDEHGAARADMADGSDVVHGALLGDAAIVKQGGAA